MSLYEICIRRPVFTVMLMAAPVVLGVASYARLGVDLFPNVDLPVVVVTTTLRGASAEEMETTVTKPIEEIVNTVSGIDELRSTTKEGYSQVTIQFKLEKSGAVAAQEVDAKIRTILSQLPVGTDPPVIDRFDLDAAPVLTIAVSGRRDFREVTEIARKRIKENLETLPGVGSVTLVGGRQRAVNVYVDPDKLLKYENLTVEDVRLALLRENQEQPGGRVDQGRGEVVLRTLGRVEKPADFEKLIVGNRAGQPVRIEDIGRVADSFEEPRGTSRLWVRQKAAAGEISDAGDNAVSLIVQKQSGENTVEVVDRVLKRLGEIRSALPDDIQAEVIRDQSRFIRKSIDEVKMHLVLAAGLVILTILVFMQDLRTTLIAALAIPTSIVGTFAFMDAMGFTLNNITILGLILAIGIVIDDAVVVNENIYRLMEEKGYPPGRAAVEGTREIALPVIATTLSLLVIFIPVAFMGGRVGRFFSSFGFVVAFSLFLSMVVSFTLTPMLCAKMLKSKPGHGQAGHGSKSGWVWRLVEGSYMLVLRWAMRHRWIVVVVAVGVLLTTPVIAGKVGKDFVPRDDQSEFEVSVTLPEGYSLQRAEEVLGQIDQRLRGLRGVTHTYLVIGDTSGRVTKGQGDVTKGTIYVRITDLEKRKFTPSVRGVDPDGTLGHILKEVGAGRQEFTQFEVMDDARAILADYPDLRAAVQDVSAFQGTGFRQVEIDFNLSGPDMDKLEKYSDEISAWMTDQGYFVDIDTSLSLRKPELRIRPDRERLSDLGVSLDAVSTTTNVMVGGLPVTKYKEAGEQYDVWLRADRQYRDDAEAIARLTVPSTKAANGVVRVGSVARIEKALGPNSIDRFGRQRQVVVSANLQGKSLGEAVEALSAHVKEMNLPPEYRWEFIGRAKTMNESNANFLIAFVLAFVFMYMILAGQFESYIQPITILAALPLTIPFALLSLWLLQTNLDIYAMFGLFMLFGIVKKNGILQVDYTNVLRGRGVPREEAILEANATRLRPIMMTTLMLLAAMVPMALGQGPGASTRSGMAKLILGGQALSLLLTLLVTPVAYSLWDDFALFAGRVWWRVFPRQERPPYDPIEIETADGIDSPPLVAASTDGGAGHGREHR
ncbi:MAG: efflux RND transporter permease subunit [Planctomycetes bacterium]|nr:efflux RND transporter permease subunit [Planctomycetota bacterium]